MLKKKFIQATTTACTFSAHVPAPYFRRTFSLAFAPQEATVQICGLGFYRLFVNGQEITKGALAPYISNPDQYCYYDTYSILPHLREGKNAIGILLGNGMMNPFGGSVWDFDKAECLGAPRLALSLDISDAQHSVHIEADEAFRIHPSPITFDELRMGEHYDARLALPNWALPEYDDHNWLHAFPAETPRGTLQKCSAEPIRVQKEISPISITPCDGGYLYDFGENTAGVTRLCIQATAGQKIEISHCEMLKDGKFYSGNIIFDRPETQFYKIYSQKTVYIASGNGREIFTPSFTYYGFRYAFVTGITSSQATATLLTAVVLHSDLQNIGDFSCSNQTLNTLFQMCVRSDLTNFYYFPTDCPHREKNGWTGDAAISAEHMVLLYDTEKSWRQWLANIRASQSVDGALPGIVPTFGWGYAWGNGPAWDRVLFQLPYVLYKIRGCTAVIEENAAAMMRYLHYISVRRAPDGTVAIGLGDWCPVGKNPDEYDAPLALTDSIMVMDMAQKAQEMFQVIGMTLQAEFAQKLKCEMRNAIRKKFIDPSTMIAAGNCQTSQAMCLSYGVFTPGEEITAFRALVDIIHRDGDNFTCGYLGMQTLFEVLSAHGESALAYHLITKPDYPSYANLITQGYTTLPEGFFPASDSTRSRNHHFFGDIARWLIRHVAGLQIIDATHVRISPSFLPAIAHARAHYDLPCGRVLVNWYQNTNKCYTLYVCHPRAVHVELFVNRNDVTLIQKQI